MLAVFARFTATGIALLCSLVLAASASAAEWIGAYGYEDGRDAVYFELSLNQKGDTISGQIIETQTFGSESSDGMLKANVSGTVRGHLVTFTKTYDGTGGQQHTVTYRGTLVSDGNERFMFGTWRLGSDVGSWFATVESN